RKNNEYRRVPYPAPRPITSTQNSMASRFDRPPDSVCILRLSAIGDTCHVLPVVRTLQRAWPQARFTWVIGKVEAKLLGHLPDIEFVVVDKRSTTAAYRT